MAKNGRTVARRPLDDELALERRGLRLLEDLQKKRRRRQAEEEEIRRPAPGARRSLLPPQRHLSLRPRRR